MRSELLAQPVLHADETPVAMLDPGAGKTHRVYLWTYCSTALQPTKLVVFDFAESRAGRHTAEFLGHPGERAWRGTLVCDDHSGYKALFASGVTEAGCLAHARRKFHELWVNHKSAVGERALASRVLPRRAARAARAPHRFGNASYASHEHVHAVASRGERQTVAESMYADSDIARALTSIRDRFFRSSGGSTPPCCSCMRDGEHRNVISSTGCCTPISRRGSQHE